VALLEVVVVFVVVVSFVTCTTVGVSFVVPWVAFLDLVFLDFLFRRCRNPFDSSPIL